MEATFVEDFRQTNDGKIFVICKLCGPLQYYSANRESFSNLSNHVARVHVEEWKKYNMKQKQHSIESFATSKIERIFSTATDIMQAKRSRTKSDLLEMRVLIKQNSGI